MNTFFQVLAFELRLQCRSALFWSLCVLLFLLHFIAQADDSINLGIIRNLININSPYQIVLTSVLFAYIGMLPVLFFIVNTMTRDYERHTAEFFFVTPVNEKHFLLGRFFGGFALATLVAVAGQLGNLVAEWMPWLDPDRLAPFSLKPYLAAFFLYSLPFVFIASAFFFTVASLTRSPAQTLVMAFMFLVLLVSLPNFFTGEEPPAWLVLLDPSGNMALTAETRFWSVTELNNTIPGRMMLGNRLLWMSLAAGVLLFTLMSFRFEVSGTRLTLNPLSLLSRAMHRSSGKLWRRKAALPEAIIIDDHPHYRTDFSWRGQLGQCLSQWALDSRSLLRSPLFLVGLLIVVVMTISEHNTATSALGTAVFPITGTRLHYFTLSLFPYTLMLLVWFAGDLVHRDRELGCHEMVSACPYPDWIMPVAKIGALWVLVSLLFLGSIVTSMALQAAAGFTRFEVGLYLRGVFFYNGVYFFLACVMAVFFQSISSNKWLGMSIMVAVTTFTAIMPMLGMENILYRLLQMPGVVHSDMNDFAPYREKFFTMALYWGLFCVLLGILAKLLMARGVYTGIRERLADARSRITRGTMFGGVLASLAFIAVGSWIYYNTHVLNDYQTLESVVRLNADYERLYGQYDNRPTPDFSDVTLTVDIFPQQRRVASSGEATLVNLTENAIDEFVLSIDPKLDIESLDIDAGHFRIADAAQGFYLVELESPLLPNQTVDARWSLSWSMQGFTNGDPDLAIVGNGSFMGTRDIGFLPGYARSRELTNNVQRERFGLPRIENRFPLLGDPEYLDVLEGGVSARANGRLILSTAADQVAVTSGVLTRQWEENGRRYFDYRTERPIFLGLNIISGRLTVARDTWGDGEHTVDIEVYYDPIHANNIETMLETAKHAMSYYTREFGPYPPPFYRIVEFPRFQRSGAQATYGMVSYSESAGFVSDMAAMGNLDFVILHELAHQWWGGRAYGAFMQGRELLNEGLAQYSTYMMYKHHDDPALIKRFLAVNMDGYLVSRGDETERELPLMLTEDQGYLSYNKGVSVMYALQDILGEDKINQALRNYLDRFSFQPPPFPTSRDLVDAIRAEAGEEYQDLITDLFEKIVFYDIRLTAARAEKIDDGYNVTIDYSATQFEADGVGNEREVPMNAWFDVVVFPASDRPLIEQAPLYQQKHNMRDGSFSLTVYVDELPGRVGIDPYRLMIDRSPGNNILDVSVTGQ